MMQAVAQSGAGFSGASALHMNIFGLNPVVMFGTEEQKQRFLPPLIRGEEKACFAVTEPDVGLDTTQLKTRAVRDGDHYVVTGQKIWISTAQVANKMLLLARTTPLEEVAKPSDGLSLFYTDLDRRFVEVREIDKMGRKAVDSNMLFIDGLRVPAADRIGEEGKGFGLHPARHEPRAHPDRRRGGRPGPRRAAPRRALRQGARRLRPADRPEPGRAASAGAMLGRARGGQADDAARGLALRRRRALRRRGQRRQVPRRRGRAGTPARPRC